VLALIEQRPVEPTQGNHDFFCLSVCLTLLLYGSYACDVTPITKLYNWRTAWSLTDFFGVADAQALARKKGRSTLVTSSLTIPVWPWLVHSHVLGLPCGF
jgi:hypothetical protein